MKVISRYTRNGQYPSFARKLAESIKRWGLDGQVSPEEDPGDWLKACNLKPSWILQSLLQCRDAVLWVDADCEIMAPPCLLFGTRHDFACYNFSADPQAGAGIAHDPNILTSSMGVCYFAYTAASIELLMRWNNAASIPGQNRTDVVFDAVYNQTRPPVSPLWLPKSYNRMDSVWPDVKPVINHVFRRGELRGGEVNYG